MNSLEDNNRYAITLNNWILSYKYNIFINNWNNSTFICDDWWISAKAIKKSRIPIRNVLSMSNLLPKSQYLFKY